MSSVSVFLYNFFFIHTMHILIELGQHTKTQYFNQSICVKRLRDHSIYALVKPPFWRICFLIFSSQIQPRKILLGFTVFLYHDFSINLLISLMRTIRLPKCSISSLMFTIYIPNHLIDKSFIFNLISWIYKLFIFIQQLTDCIFHC